MDAPDSTHFKVDGVPPAKDAAFRTAATEVQTNFDRSAGTNGTYTFTMKPNVQVNLRDEAVVQARQTIERRVNELGVTEPSIAQQGTNGDQILVQLPGVTDVERAKEIIRSTGLLELKIVEQGPAPTKDALLVNGQVPQGMEIVPGATGTPGDANTVYYLVQKAAAVTGQDLRNARALARREQPAGGQLHAEQRRRPQVRQGHRREHRPSARDRPRRPRPVGAAHRRPDHDRRPHHRQLHAGRSAEPVADPAVRRAAGVARPTSRSGRSARASAPTRSAPASLASVVGLLLVVVFMLIYYKLSGVNAVVALVFNLVILLGLMAYIGAVMTLPGIAGFVLTMGIGVDSNVLIFERIKEELEAQRGVRASINAGFGRVFWTLVDTHMAALISCAFLFQFGTGPIRGFAVTLVFGLVSNLFTSIFVSKTLFEVALAGRGQVATLSI